MDEQVLRTLILITILTLPFKIVALWRSARSDQKWWFGAFIVFNSLGILELTYLFYFTKSKDKQND